MSLDAAIAAWLPQQRWYATKHLSANVRVAEIRDLGGPYRLAFVSDAAPETPVVYQVPLAFGTQPPPGVAVVGRVGEEWVWDACGDAGCQALRLGLAQPVPVRVLSGEQSNTSVICELPTGPVMTKVFRVLQDGPNPDVEVTKALTEAGCRFVPRFVSSAYGTHPAGEGHLQVTNEFIAGAEDAWRTALVSAREGGHFEARELGATVADVHGLLARVFGDSGADPSRIVDEWRRRAATALSTIPELRDLAAAIDRVFDAALAAEWPQLQRVHGDLHLGQVIRSGRGWILLDFEGEPLRTLAERRLPDLALRDVAGMLRSFDYAQASSGATDALWAAHARADFLDGYAEVAHEDPRESGTLLTALELDKALYEAVYEASNRPDWLHVPLAGIRRLLNDIEAHIHTERMGE